MKQQVLAFLKKQSFQPGVAGIFLNPFYFIRRQLFLHVQEAAPQLKGKLLDFGCGRKPYRNLFTHVDEYIGVDIEQETGHDHTLSQVDVYYDGKTIPFGAETFDAAFCSEVLEHVFNIEEILTELNRVMKKDAHLLLTVPFCWNEHEVPYDFGRYTSFGIKHLLEKHGFEIVTYQKSGHFFQVNAQLLALYFYETFKKLVKAKAPHYILSMLFIVPINIAGLVFSFLLPRNRSLYFNNVVVARKQ